MIDLFTAPEPCVTFLGLQVDAVRADFCRMRLPFRPELCQAQGVVHGGFIAALIDSAGIHAVLWQADAAVTRGGTTNLTVSYLAAARAVDLTAEARVLRRGRNVVFVEVDVAAPDGTRIAKGLVTYSLVYSNNRPAR
jgi:uncharacterized protein (TIGR00369 family)